ncbi:MFS transporter [Streptomyces sp. NPDC102467]|uniref:MFS transporter n=1 Tax=Streptomyces sp. NPDC102467 TaxID=3366179 RepID=UPI0038194DE5
MTSDSTTWEARTTYGDVLADRRFRLLLSTRALTVTADALRVLTLSVLVFAATGSPLLSAVTFGAGFLPQLAGSLVLGSLADRVRPRGLVVAGHVLQCGAAAVLGTVHLPVPAVLALVAAVAALTPVSTGAVNRLVADTLAGDAYVLGRSLLNVSASVAQLLGLAVGGAAVAFLGPRTALLVSAAAYLAAAVAVRVRLPDLSVPERSAEPQRRRGSGSVLWDSWSGGIGLLADRRVRALLLAQWLPPLFVAGAEGLVVPFAEGRRMPDGTAGVLLACLPVGMLAGDLAVGRLLRPAARERLAGPLVVVLGLPLTGFALDPPRVACAALLLVTGVGFAYALGLQRPFLEAVPEARRGQAFGLLTAGLMSVQGVGPVVFGTVAELTGAGTAIALAGLATVCAAVGTSGGTVWRPRRGADGVITRAGRPAWRPTPRARDGDG